MTPPICPHMKKIKIKQIRINRVLTRIKSIEFIVKALVQNKSWGTAVKAFKK